MFNFIEDPKSEYLAEVMQLLGMDVTPFGALVITLLWVLTCICFIAIKDLSASNKHYKNTIKKLKEPKVKIKYEMVCPSEEELKINIANVFPDHYVNNKNGTSGFNLSGIAKKALIRHLAGSLHVNLTLAGGRAHALNIGKETESYVRKVS